MLYRSQLGITVTSRHRYVVSSRKHYLEPKRRQSRFTAQSLRGCCVDFRGQHRPAPSGSAFPAFTTGRTHGLIPCHPVGTAASCPSSSKRQRNAFYPRSYLAIMVPDFTASLLVSFMVTGWFVPPNSFLPLPNMMG